jgi:hypothetical protein
MKIKLDFITNSSSANFTIPKIHLNEKQILMIHSHIELGNALMCNENRNWNPTQNDGWQVRETKDAIEGSTYMDNFDMLWFLEKIGIKRDHINYSHSNDAYYDRDEDEH